MRVLWVRFVALRLSEHTEAAIESENQRIDDRLTRAATATELRRGLFGRLLLRRALDSITPRAPVSLIRPADWLSYIRARIKILLGQWPQEGDPVYFFYESFGYRFVILVDLQSRRGVVTHFCRVDNPSNDNAGDCLAQAEMFGV